MFSWKNKQMLQKGQEIFLKKKVRGDFTFQVSESLAKLCNQISMILIKKQTNR